MNDHAGFIDREFGAVCAACGSSVFSETCRPLHFHTTGLDFSLALRHLKLGHRVRRAGWNGKGMWLKLADGTIVGGASAKEGSAVVDRVLEIEAMGGAPAIVTVRARIDMRAADGSIVIGWLASQTDLLASDWEVVL